METGSKKLGTAGGWEGSTSVYKHFFLSDYSRVPYDSKILKEHNKIEEGWKAEEPQPTDMRRHDAVRGTDMTRDAGPGCWVVLSLLTTQMLSVPCGELWHE